MQQDKSHQDYVEVIGRTNSTNRSYLEKRWNQYYFTRYCQVVSAMLKDESRESIIDVGTSHGSWFNFCRSQGFRTIYGVEMHQGRAEQARKLGYTEVFHTNAAQIPLEDDRIDCAISNDVFVHILKTEDKIAVLKSIERILRPGGALIFNHAMSYAFAKDGYAVENYNSYMSLHGLISLIKDNTTFEIVCIKPTYYSYRASKKNAYSALWHIIAILPMGVRLLCFLDLFSARDLTVQMSDTVYFKLKKHSQK